MTIETRVERYINVHANEAYCGSLRDRVIDLGYASSDGIALRAVIISGFDHDAEGLMSQNSTRGLAFLYRVKRDIRAYKQGVDPGVKLNYHPGEIIEVFASIAYANDNLNKEQAIKEALQDMPKFAGQLLRKVYGVNSLGRKPATAEAGDDIFRMALLLQDAYARVSGAAVKDYLYKHSHTGLAGIKVRAAEACPIVS